MTPCFLFLLFEMKEIVHIVTKFSDRVLQEVDTNGMRDI